MKLFIFGQLFPRFKQCFHIKFKDKQDNNNHLEVAKQKNYLATMQKAI